MDINTNTQIISVGVVGAGVWADRVHIPALQVDARFRIAGVWARRPDQARALGERFGIEAILDFDDLLAVSDVVDLAVPPSVQPSFAMLAAERGKHLILEKPVGMRVAGLDELQKTVTERNLAARVFVTRFFDPRRVETVQALAAEPWVRAKSVWRSSAFLAGNPFATAWRDADAILFDVGPHSISQLEAILGPVIEGAILSRTETSVLLGLKHPGGKTSEAVLDVGADVSSLEETLTLWGAATEVQPVLVPAEPRLAFGRLLDRLIEDIASPRRSPAQADDPTSLAAGIRMVSILERLAGTWPALESEG